jgi:3-oxoacyl-[acyl-carrier-protein] synthase-3
MATAVEKSQIAARQLEQSEFHTLTGVQILGTGGAAPDQIVRNEDLAALGYDADWIVQRTGIHERRCAPDGMTTSDLAAAAARKCLELAKVDACDVDLIVVATMSPDTRMPSSACHLQRKLGTSAASFDVNAACAGFMFGLTTAAQFVKTGCSKRALIVGADIMSQTVNPADKKTFPLFGDGAGAVLLGPGDSEQGLVSYTLGSDGEGADLLCIPAGGSREPITAQGLRENRQFVYMNGRPVFKWAVRLVADSIRGALAHADLTVNDVDFVVLHQANVRIIDAIANDLKIDRDKLIINLDRYGNTSAASIPLALDEAVRDDRIHAGDLVLMCGFGAGLTWGTALVRW